MNNAGKMLGVVLSLGLLGCAHSTSIKAEPEGTKIFVNGEYLGQDRVSTSIGNGLLGSYTVRAVHPELPALEVVVDQPHLDWGLAAAAAGGCLGVGCAGGVCSFLAAVTVLQFAPPAVFMVGPIVIPIVTAAVTGGPFLTLLGWSTHGPDALKLDLKRRQVEAIPATKVTIVGDDKPVAPESEPRPSVQPSPAPAPSESPAEDAAPAPIPAEPEPENQVKPFDY